jgi:hypothetical protein
VKFQLFNGPMQTTASGQKVGTGTAIKTMQQVCPKIPMYLEEFGCSFDGFTAATPIQVELIDTESVQATVTAYAAADITLLDADALLFVANGGSITTTYFTVSTSASGYTASAEGTPTAARNLAGPWLLPPTAPFVLPFLPDSMPLIPAGNTMRVRVTAPTGVNMQSYVRLRAA